MIENKYPLWSDNHSDIKKERKKVTVGELLFFLALFLFFLKFLFDYSKITGGRNEILDPMLLGSFLACLMIKISLQRYTPVRLAFTAIIGAVMGYSCLISTNYFVFIGMMFILAMQDIAFEKLLKFCFIFKTSSITAHVIMYIFTYLTNPSVITFVYRGGEKADGRPRHYFFMGHANMFTAFLIWTCMEFIFLNYKRLTAFHIIIIWLINVVFYMFTDSNTGILVLTIITGLILMDKIGKGLFDGVITFFAKYTYLFCAVFFSFLTIIYTHLNGTLKELWHTLNKFFTGRIWLGAHAYSEHGFTILGVKDIPPMLVYWQDRWFDTATVFDNYYIGNFVSYGVINSIVIALAFIILCGKMENREKIAIISFSFYGVMESHMINISICFALLIIGKYLYKSADK